MNNESTEPRTAARDVDALMDAAMDYALHGGHERRRLMEHRRKELTSRLAAIAPTTNAEVDPEVEKVWREHWLPIVAPEGELDLARVKAELFDYGMLLDNVSLVYDYVTGGVASKPFTLPSVINSLHDDYVRERVNEALEDEREIKSLGL